MTFRVRPAFSHQHVVSHSSAPSGSRLRNGSLNHHIPKPPSLQPRNFDRHYSVQVNREEQRILRKIAEQQNRSHLLPEPGTKEYERLRYSVGEMIKHEGKDPHIVLTSIDEGLNTPMIPPYVEKPLEKASQVPATKKDIQDIEFKFEDRLKRIESMIERLGVELSQSGNKEGSSVHTYSSK
ncbi:MAG TPA: hypothetical protein VMR37_02115 [Rhabdochlamydiaceae bacterium]|nr:hypothetical protein [Rhabdochlamydiaceae bacterium]